MATDKKRSTGRRIIDLDALLNNAPMITLAGLEFEAREVSLEQRQQWLDVEREGDRVAQQEVLAVFLSERGPTVTPEWVGKRTQSQLIKFVQLLFGEGVEDDSGNV